MGLTKEYEDLDKERLAAGEKSRAHYKSLNLPGDRTKTNDTAGVKARVAAMKLERDKPINP